MTDLTPTPEQQQAIDLFLQGHSMAIEAKAGTGKTATLKMLAEAIPERKVAYVAFNKAIVLEARDKMPGNVGAFTAHSLAYRATVADDEKMAERLRRKRTGRHQQAMLLGIDRMVVTNAAGEKVNLAAGFLAGVVLAGIRRFCSTVDLEPTTRHLPRLDGLDLDDEWEVNDRVRAALDMPLRKAWADLRNPDGDLKLEHDHYLKFWHLDGATIPYDVILFDEAQDADPVMRAVVAAQDHAQVVWVGDSQQQIYAWRGAVNALGEVDTDRRTFLSQSFRFGPAIADVANGILDQLDADGRVVGNPNMESTLARTARPDAILCRTNAAAVSLVLQHLAAGNRPHLVGGGTEVVRFAEAAQKLMEGGVTYHHELACFGSWDEVCRFVHEDQQGGDLRLMVSLVNEFGPETIIDGLSNMPPEAQANVIVSTAHKAKGREWHTVALGSDFPAEADKIGDEEWRLLYVAVTRAQLVLDVTRVPVLAEDGDQAQADADEQDADDADEDAKAGVA